MNDEEMKDLIKRLVRAKASDEVFDTIERWLIDYNYSDEWEDTAECELGNEDGKLPNYTDGSSGFTRNKNENLLGE